MTEQRTPSGGRDATDVARREKDRVADTARDAASEVGDRAAEHGQALQRDAARHARSVARDAQRELRGHAREETARAGAALSTAGDQLRALADGRIDDAGVLGDYVEQAARVVNRWADRVQERGFDGLVDDLRTFGRRRPGAFLASALAAGVIVGRFGRNAAGELDDDHERGDGARDDSGWGDSGPSDDRSAPPTSTSDRDTGEAPADRDVEQRATADDRDAAWRPTDGLVDASPRATGGADPATSSTGSTRAHARDDDVIVGYASDDAAVVVPPPAEDARDDDVAFHSVDVDRGGPR